MPLLRRSGASSSSSSSTNNNSLGPTSPADGDGSGPSSGASGSGSGSGSSEVQWCFSQVKGTLDDDVTEADIISCVEFNQDGDLLATGDKGGRVVIFQRDPAVS